MNKTLSLSLLTLAFAAAALGVHAAGTAPGKVQSALAAQEQLDKNAAAAQKKMDKTEAGTQDMLNQYLQVTQATDETRTYDDQLAQIIQAQTDEMNSLNTQMSQVGDVEKSLPPLMLQMADSLAQYVKLDIPYREDERTARMQQLHALMINPAVSVTDKFQKLIQAYKDEIAAGKTVESYRGELTQGGKTLTVNFLRVGHLLLAYQTLDRSDTGYWDKQQHQWVSNNDYRSAVAQAIAITNKQAPPDLMQLPVPAPEVGK
jgi:phage host-nuclease inhibitor protein Gam